MTKGGTGVPLVVSGLTPETISALFVLTTLSQLSGEEIRRAAAAEFYRPEACSTKADVGAFSRIWIPPL